ncbi:MAG: putative baseplate assembly protein [Candidatus Tectimicrobiota bacterium]
MAVPPPPIDRRDREALLQELQALLPFYTPTWQVGETGPGRALVEVFLLFQREVIARLNRVPEKLFLAFLDQLGLALLPALPARAPVIFTPAQGSTSSLTVPAGTQVAAGETVFQTAAAFAATPAALRAVFSVVPAQDVILNHLPALGQPEPAPLFTAAAAQPNLQEHSLYLGDAALLHVHAASTLTLTLKTPQPEMLRALHREPAARTPALVWEWWGKAAGPGAVEAWQPFAVTVLALHARTSLQLALRKEAGEIKASTLHGVTSRWIRCRLEGALLPGDPLADLTMHAIELSVAPPLQGVAPEAAFANDFPLPLPPTPGQPLLPFGIRPRQGDTWYLAGREALSKPGARVTLTLTASASGVEGIPVAQVYGIGKNFHARLAAAGVMTTADLLRLTPGQVAEIIRNSSRNLPASRYLRKARALQEAAAKQYYDTTATPRSGAAPVGGSVPRLSWEYWNGRGWVALAQVEDSTSALLATGSVSFVCPDDLLPTAVGGQEHYWLRVRLAAGDYGQEKFRFTGSTWETDTTDIQAPQIAALAFSYTVPQPQPLAQVVSLNNLHAVSLPLPGFCRPFVPLPDVHQALYVGFDAVLQQGPFTLLFALQEQEYPAALRPRVIWEYCRAATATAWERLHPDDGTSGLIRTGILTFLSPSDAAEATLFGQRRFWIRAVDLEERFNAALESSLPVPGPTASASRGALMPCPEAMQALQVLLPSARLQRIPVPRVSAIYPNAGWVLQVASIQDERFGSSDGTAQQAFRLARAPVTAATVWVNEVGTLTEEEIAQIKADPTGGVREEVDLMGSRLALWIRWQPCSDLTRVGREARCYLLDPVQGLIQFGDGLHGKIPPPGQENLRADYQVGGGQNGNVGAGQIKEVKSSLARLDSVTNPLPATQGEDTESLARLLERGPQFLRHRNRAVTREDYEWLAREASRAVAKVRCVPNLDDQGQRRPGWVTVLIVPTGAEAQPTPSPALKEQVKHYLSARAPYSVTSRDRLVVSGPVYLRYAVAVDLYATRLDVAAAVESAALQQLAAFLHPLSGGLDGQGWAFGQVPCLSDIIALLHTIPGVDHLAQVTARVEEARSGTAVQLTMDGVAAVTPSPYTLVSSGVHHINLKLKVA